jgi:hypothetical protein
MLGGWRMDGATFMVEGLAEKTNVKHLNLAKRKKNITEQFAENNLN